MERESPKPLNSAKSLSHMPLAGRACHRDAGASLIRRRSGNSALAAALAAAAAVAGTLLLFFTTQAQADEPRLNEQQANEQQKSSPQGDAAGTADAGAGETPPSGAEGTGGKLLKGGVKGSALRTEDGLIKIGEAACLVQGSCMKIMKEATRKDTIVVRGPNVLPGGVVIPPLGGTGGVMQFGEMPMRRDRLERFIAESAEEIKALQNYIDALIVPEDKTESFVQILSKIRLTAQGAEEHLQNLKDLSAARKLANTKIGREALSIHDAMTALENSRAQIMDMIKGQATQKESGGQSDGTD